MKTVKRILGFLLCMSLIASLSCYQGFANKHILVGKYQFYNYYEGSRQKCFNVNVDFLQKNHNGQVMASPSSWSSFTSIHGIDFVIKAGFTSRRPSEVLIQLLVDNDKSWKIFEVNYIVTERHDIWVGSFEPDTFAFLGCSNKGRRSASLNGILPSFKPVTKNFKILGFISGLRTSASRAKIELRSMSINNLNAKITAQIFSNSQIQFLQISYIIYEVNQAFTIIPYSQLNRKKHDKGEYYWLKGISQFKKRHIDYHGIIFRWNIIRCKGSGCPSECISIEECEKYGGVFWEKQCLLCKKGQILYENQCRQPCRLDQIYANGRCQCKNDEVEVNGICRQICARHAYLLNNKCVCLPGFYKYLRQCRKIPKCGNYAVFNGHKCVCKDGYYSYNQNCVSIPTCGHYEKLVNNECVCLEGYVRVGSNCIKCGNEHQIINNGRCECKPWYRRINGRCIYDVKCGENQEIINHRCECIKGFVRDEYNRCLPKCKFGQIWHQKYNCICISSRAINVNGNCIECPQYSAPNSARTECVCQTGYTYESKWNKCLPNHDCPENSFPVANQHKYQCFCKPGYVYQSKWNKCFLKPQCPENSLPFTTEFEIKCICRDGYEWSERWDKCFFKPQCPENSLPFATEFEMKCICRDGYEWSERWNKCFLKPQCPQNSLPIATEFEMKCICRDGYEWSERWDKCFFKPQCPENSLPIATEFEMKCICKDGYVWQQKWNKCMQKPYISCPSRSSWNPKTLSCQCIYENEYLINNKCSKCEAHEKWNGQQCICITDYFKIGGHCRTCDPNTHYDGNDCICNLGFYGTRNKCERCHPTCGKCKGPNFNQCLTCTDVSFNLNNGICARNFDCPNGLFLDSTTKNCQPCSSYCNSCKSQEICDSCIVGFQKQSLSHFGITVSFCRQTCGDGKRFQLECDDGNKINGDGCNSKCQIEEGWTCNGGSSIRPSTCVSFTPNRVYINPTKAVHLFGKVVHGFQLTHIPRQLTENECAQCHKLVWVKVVQSDIVPGIKVSYLPKSTYQFFIEFDFHGTFSIPVFKFSLQLNPAYKQHFSLQDMSQLKIVRVDPSTLKKIQEENELSLDDIIPLAAIDQIRQ